MASSTDLQHHNRLAFPRMFDAGQAGLTVLGPRVVQCRPQRQQRQVWLED